MTQTYRSPKGQVLARTCWFTALLNGVFATAQAEEALMRPPPSSTAPTTPSNPVVPGNPADYSDKWSPSPLKYGPVDAHITLFGGVLYDDNIYTTDDDEESDVIFSISPRVTLGMGDYRVGEQNFLTLEYTPSFVFYADNSDLNEVNHAASGAGQYQTGPWLFNLSQGYLHLFDASVDSGSILSRDIYTTLADVRYEISPKTSAQLSGRQSINDVGDDDQGDVNSYNEWTVEGFVDYGFSPKVKAGLGLSAGWRDNRASVNSTYQQLLARIAYAVTEKVDLQARAGGQLQQFEEVNGQSADNRLNGIFSLGVSYRPVEKTALALGAYREDRSSVVLINEAYTVTGFDLSVRQALSDRVTAGISGGYSFTDYYGTTEATEKTSDRQDHFWRVQLSVDWRVLEQLSVGVFYQFRQDDSRGVNADQFSFENNQVGLNLSYRF